MCSEQLSDDYHIMATARDTTERDEMEERLRRERLLFELIIENTSEGIIVVDNELRHLVWNAAMERINGEPRSAVCWARPSLKSSHSLLIIRSGAPGARR